MEYTEIAIVGGGPAGALCALILAREGADVRLMHWDGYAPGGVELISGRGRQMTERHCPGLFARIPGMEIRETVSLWGTREPVTFNAMFSPWGSGIALERSLLDRTLRSLAEGAGAFIVPDAKVMSVEREEGNWKLLLRQGENNSVPDYVAARFLIMATGRAATSLINRPPVAEPSQIALMALLPEVPAQHDDPGHSLYLEAAQSGWWYALPTLNGGYFTGFCTRREKLKKRKTALREFFVQELKRTRLLAPLFNSVPRDFPISGRIAGMGEFRGAGGEGWIAVGDAAFAPDPLSGMGIDWAIESAELGAEVLLQAIRGARQGTFSKYDRTVRERAKCHEQIASHYYASN